MQWPLAMEEQANLQRKDSDPQENDVAIHDKYQADINDFENIEPDHHERLRDLTHEIDHLQQKVEANKTGAYACHKPPRMQTYRLALMHCPSTPLEPIEEVMQQYATLYVLHKRKHPFVNTLLQDIMIFNGNNSSQLEDWLIDIETTSDLTGKK